MKTPIVICSIALLLFGCSHVQYKKWKTAPQVQEGRIAVSVTRECEGVTNAVANYIDEVRQGGLVLARFPKITNIAADTWAWEVIIHLTPEKQVIDLSQSGKVICQATLDPRIVERVEYKTSPCHEPLVIVASILTWPLWAPIMIIQGGD